MIWTRVLVVMACWALLLPFLGASAQDTFQPGEPAVQTVAHGVMAMPAEMMVWQSELERAVVSPRAEAVPQPGGFVLADTGALVITDADGKPLQRLAPGEATWIDPAAVRAIVSLEGRSAGLLRISLIPAGFIPDDPGAASYGDPFAAPTGVADLDLLRDVLGRGEELVVGSGETPALLQVTSGKVFVTDESGAIDEVAAGSPLQFQGQLTLSGGSRAPAAVVIARLGPQVPARLELRDPNATPIATPMASSLATPIALTENAALSVEAWLCPLGYDESAPVMSCTTSAAGVRFTAEDERESANVLAGVDGIAAFPALTPGHVTLRANLPEGATTAVATCRDLRGDALGRVRDNAVALSVQPGAQVACAWFIEVGDTWPAASLTVSVLACPPGMTARALRPEFCLLPDPDVTLQLAVEDAILDPAHVGDGTWVWAPLLEHSYELSLPDLSTDLNGAVLDDGTGDEEGKLFSIDLGDDLAPVHTIYLLQPPGPNAAEIDSDADRLTDAHELEIGTDPYLADSDGDGLPDGDETGFYGSDPLLADTDDDGLDDQEEVAVFFTNPFLTDTDGDGVSDADELAVQTNPLDLLSVPPTPTPVETATPPPTPPPTPTPPTSPVVPAATPSGQREATPVSAATRVPAALPTRSPEATPNSYRATPASWPDIADAASALDNDGLATLDEIAIYGTDPVTSDTDGDGLNDGDEVASGRDPLDAAN